MTSAVLLAAFLVGGNGGEQDKALWLKLDQARCVSSRTGKPILVYVACDPTTGRLV